MDALIERLRAAVPGACPNAHFEGTRVYTVDPKGRVTMPQTFRALLGDPFVLVRAAGGMLMALPEPVWEQVERDFSGQLGFFEYYASSAVRATSHPKTGRFLVPHALRDHGHVVPGRDVAVVGLGPVVVLCDHAVWAANFGKPKPSLLTLLLHWEISHGAYAPSLVSPLAPALAPALARSGGAR